MAFECPRRSSPPSPMFDADTGCIATDPAPSARRRFRSKTGIENLPANEHAQETPHTPSPTRTTRRIQSGCAGSRPRLRDGMPGSPSQHIDITRAKWIPYYHNWTYDQQGRLTGVTLERGRGGIGGFAADFDNDRRLGLRRFTVGSIAGSWCSACLGDNPPPLEDYLGPAIVHRLERIMARPITITGYQRHTIRARLEVSRWKTRAISTTRPMLHKFFGAFGIDPTRAATRRTRVMTMWASGYAIV